MHTSIYKKEEKMKSRGEEGKTKTRRGIRRREEEECKV